MNKIFLRSFSGFGAKRSRGPRNSKNYDWFRKNGVDEVKDVLTIAKPIKKESPLPKGYNTPELQKQRTRVFLEFSTGATDSQRVVLGSVNVTLITDLLPKTCNNFIKLIESNKLQNTIIHRIVKDNCIIGGDIDMTDGKSSRALIPEVDGGLKFNDENFTIKHSAPGVISMVNSGRDSNGSQFLISLKPLPHLNGKNVAFGLVENESLPLLQKIGASFTFMQKPLTKIVISKCGML